jgi:hypothetical protein
MRAFFHGVDAERQQTHKIERRVPHAVFNTAIHGGISGGSQTWCPFSELPGGIIFQLTLKDLGHPKPKIPVHCDNATMVGIANNTIK